MNYFPCKECELSFPSKSALNQHMVTHSAETYSCPICKKVFDQRSCFYKHKDVHSNTKKFKCNECDKSFAQRSNLKRHQMIHDDVKPFECQQCSKRFNSKDNLNQHSLVHSKKYEMIPCKVKGCSKEYKYFSSLKTHIKNDHKEYFEEYYSKDEDKGVMSPPALNKRFSSAMRQRGVNSSIQSKVTEFESPKRVT